MGKSVLGEGIKECSAGRQRGSRVIDREVNERVDYEGRGVTDGQDALGPWEGKGGVTGTLLGLEGRNVGRAFRGMEGRNISLNLHNGVKGEKSYRARWENEK